MDTESIKIGVSKFEALVYLTIAGVIFAMAYVDIDTVLVFAGGLSMLFLFSLIKGILAT